MLISFLVVICLKYCVISICTYYVYIIVLLFFFFKQKTAYEMRISDWSSDVCSQPAPDRRRTGRPRRRHDAAQPSAGPILRRKLARADRGGAHRQRPARSAPRRTDDPVGGRPVPRARLQAGPAPFVGEQIGSASCRGRVWQIGLNPEGDV